jgi:hypothetical protein
MADVSKAVPLIGCKNVNVLLHSAVPGKAPVVSLFVDLSKDLGLSSTGKTTMVASSAGSRPLGGSGAVLGLNIFSKATRNLKAIKELTGKQARCGTGIMWEVLAPHTLHIEMTLTTPGKVSASGKTCLLATSSGNKPIGTTGITFGVNCFTKVGVDLNVERLAALSSAVSELADGITLDNSDAKWSVLSFDLSSFKVNTPTSINGSVPPGATVALTATLQSAVAAEGDEDEDAPEPQFSAVQETLNLESFASSRSLQLRFDRTLRFGESSSGKSIAIASSRGGKVIGKVKITLNAYTAAPPKSPAATQDDAPSEKAVREAVDAFLATISDSELPSVKMSEVRTAVKKALKIDDLEDFAKETIRTVVTECLLKRRPAKEEGEEKSPKKARTE